MTIDDGDRFSGWTPIRFYGREGQAMVDWCETGARRFVDPFFRETVEKALANPAVSLLRRQTPIETLEDQARNEPGLMPTGFIYHASRCGSTLLAQMLAVSSGNRVLSEPGPVDEILKTLFDIPSVPEERRISWLRAMVSSLGHPQGDERRYFLKLDPWHIVALPFIRRAFPEVPWVFLFREPLEILASQERSYGSQFVVGPLPSELFGVDLLTAAAMTPIDYAALVLHQLFAAAESSVHDGGLVVTYRDLPGALDRILHHFGVEPGSVERLEMFGAARFNSKMPQQLFDSRSNSEQVTSTTSPLSAELLLTANTRLLALQQERMEVSVP